jgi:calpain-15
LLLIISYSLSKGQAFDRLVHWRRAKDFMEIDPSKGLLDPQVFSKIEPNDIIQGQLSDCWFLCAVSSLAERPALVERIFVTKEYNEQGIY